MKLSGDKMHSLSRKECQFLAYCSVFCFSHILCCLLNAIYVFDSLHKQIMDIGGNKLKMVESRLNVISTQIDQTTGLMNKASVAVKSAKRSVDLFIHF
jgi:hypothetical protein